MLSDRCWHFIYTETCTKLFFIPGNGFTYNAWCNHFNQNMSIMQYYKIWEETSCSNHLHIIIQFTSNICGHDLNWIHINRRKESLHLMANIHILFHKLYYAEFQYNHACTQNIVYNYYIFKRQISTCASLNSINMYQKINISSIKKKEAKGVSCHTPFKSRTNNFGIVNLNDMFYQSISYAINYFFFHWKFRYIQFDLFYTAPV